MKFQGTIETDGVCVSAIKQNTTTNRKPALPKTKNTESDNFTPRYIESLPQTELVETKVKCVLMDLGRQDLLYCMKETSASQKNGKLVATYTKMTRIKLARLFKILRKKSMPVSIQSSEKHLSKTKSFSVNLEEYEEYIKARDLAEKVLGPYYGNETQQTKQDYFYNHYFDFHVKNKAALYF